VGVEEESIGLSSLSPLSLCHCVGPTPSSVWGLAKETPSLEVPFRHVSSLIRLACMHGLQRSEAATSPPNSVIGTIVAAGF